MKMITVDDVIEICHINIAPLSARHQNVAVTALRRVIDSAKEYAVEAVPVKHGEWRKDDNTHYRCTACLNFLVSKGNARFYDYCPNCGARMDFKECDTE